MKTLLTFATIALSVAALAAGPKEGPKKHGPRGPMENKDDPVVQLVTNPKMAEKIGLTKDQQAKIREIGKECRNGRDEMNKQLKETMKKQTELLKAEKVDEAAVMAEIDKAFDIRKELAKRQTRRIIQIKAVLTPEQVEKALAEIKERQKREKEKAEAKAKADASDGDKGCKACEDKKDCEKCEKKCEGEDKPRKHQKRHRQAEKHDED